MRRHAAVRSELEIERAERLGVDAQTVEVGLDRRLPHELTPQPDIVDRAVRVVVGIRLVEHRLDGAVVGVLDAVEDVATVVVGVAVEIGGGAREEVPGDLLRLGIADIEVQESVEILVGVARGVAEAVAHGEAAVDRDAEQIRLDRGRHDLGLGRSRLFGRCRGRLLSSRRGHGDGRRREQQRRPAGPFSRGATSPALP